MAGSGKRQQNATRWALAALVLAVVVLVGLTLHGLHETPASATGAALPAHAGSGVPPELAREVPPWQATAENTAAAPPGTVPVWRVNPPAPDPSTPMPGAPVEPPNPALHRAPLHNPGGVNSDRPERSVPGLE